ncbi:WD40-repeat-containing domain protein [Mycena amicta]|nr:WD40-repeat-containing domain protein [Mycena amicta]
MMLAKDFYRSWTHSVSSDFEKDGVPASSEPEWMSRTGSIDFPATDSDSVEAIALSVDGKHIAIGLGANVHLYDAATIGQKLVAGYDRIVVERSRPVRQPLVRLWDLDAGYEDRFAFLEEAAKAAFAAAQPALAHHWALESDAIHSLQKDIAQLFLSKETDLDIDNGRLLAGHLSSYSGRPFTHDGSLLFYISKSPANEVVLLDAQTGVERFRLAGHTDGIMWASPSPDDTVFATSSWDKTVRIWDIYTGNQLCVLTGATNQCWGGAFSPDGALVAVGEGNKTVHVWRVDTGERLHSFGGFNDWPRSVAFSPDGVHLAAGAGSGTLKVFNTNSRECVQTWQIDLSTNPHTRSFLEASHVSYSTRGDLFFGSSEGRLFGYRTAGNVKWEVMGREQAGHISHFVLSRDGKILVADSGSKVEFWKIL